MAKEWNIVEIEGITEETAKEMATEMIDIKGHNVYLIDFGGYFKYSACVFLNGKHIYHANDYELHHSNRDRAWLKQWYIDTLNYKLYTESEILEPIKDYDEATKKEHYLRNYYPMQKDRVSIFAINPSEEEKMEFKKRTANMTYNPFSFCYMEDAEFVKHQAELFRGLQKRKAEMENNYDYYVDAFLSEMYNHEYGINWQADYDTLSAFGNVEWHEDDINAYFEELKFTETQRKAYMEARRKYFKSDRCAV